MMFIAIDLCSFILAVFLHVLWCRCQKRVGIRSISFVIINLVFLIIVNIFFYYYLQRLDAGRYSGDLWRMRIPLTATILYFLAIPGYLVFYHSLFIESPSRALLDYAGKSKKVTREDLLRYFEDKKFIETRLATLVETGCVQRQETSYRLLPPGQKVQGFYKFYQRLLHREKGG